MRDGAEHRQRHAPDQPDVHVAAQRDAVLVQVVEKAARLELHGGQAPRLDQVQRHREALLPQGLRGPVEDRLFLVVEGRNADRIEHPELTAGGLRVREDVVLERGGEPDGQVLIEERGTGQRRAGAGRPVTGQAPHQQGPAAVLPPRAGDRHGVAQLEVALGQAARDHEVEFPVFGRPVGGDVAAERERIGRPLATGRSAEADAEDPQIPRVG